MTQKVTLVVVLLLAILGHGLLWIGLVNRLHSWAGPRRVVDGLTYACVGLCGMIPLYLAWHLRLSPLASLSEEGLRLPVVYVGLCAVFGCVMLIVKPISEHRRYDRSVMTEWRAERHDAAAVVDEELHQTSRTRLLRLFPWDESLQISVDRRTLLIPRLPAALDGISICHLSDIHLNGGIGRKYFELVVEQANRAAADVACVSGDIIESDECRPWLAEALGRLSAPLGVYFILGNHDFYVDENQTREALQDCGWTYASGRWIDAKWRRTDVRIVGNEMPWQGLQADFHQRPDRGQEELRIVLSHSPDQFRWSTTADADLVPAGHTHGGQVQLPWLGVVASPSRYGAKYACGVFRRDQTVMHVSRGISGENPLRWRCPPEVAILRLEAPKSQA